MKAALVALLIAAIPAQAAEDAPVMYVVDRAILTLQYGETLEVGPGVYMDEEAGMRVGKAIAALQAENTSLLTTNAELVDRNVELESGSGATIKTVAIIVALALGGGFVIGKLWK